MLKYIFTPRFNLIDIALFPVISFITSEHGIIIGLAACIIAVFISSFIQAIYENTKTP